MVITSVNLDKEQQRWLQKTGHSASKILRVSIMNLQMGTDIDQYARKVKALVDKVSTMANFIEIRGLTNEFLAEEERVRQQRISGLDKKIDRPRLSDTGVETSH